MSNFLVATVVIGAMSLIPVGIGLAIYTENSSWMFLSVASFIFFLAG